MKRILCVLLVLSVGGCSNSSASRAALHKAGYTKVQITGWAPFNCGEDDTFSTGFEAENPNGERVEGVVCCGFLAKGCTIRF